MQTSWRDLKYAIRGLRRSPGFTAAVIFALALGIGSNAVIFSAIHAVLLNPVAFRKLRDPERLVMIWERNPSMSAFLAERLPARLRNFRAWKNQARSFEDLGVWTDTSLTLTANDDRSGLKPEQVETGIASANFFPLLGVRLQMGRNFSAQQMQTAILSDELYKSRFGNDPKILEKYFTANGKQYRIVGVLPPGFTMPAFWGGFDQKKPKLWIPVDLHPPAEQEERFLYFVFARLKPGVRISEAQAEMRVIAQRLSAARPDTNANFGANVSSVDAENAGPDIRRALLVLQVAVAFVLLIACANAGNLVLTRALERDKEVAVRAALGASRWSIVRQAFTESLVLSILAAGVGLLIAFWAQMLFIKFAPEDVHVLADIRMDGVVAAYAVGLSAAAALLSVLFPAVHAWKEDIHEVLSRTGRGTAGSSRRLRNALAATEIALSLVVLTGQG